MLCHLMCQSVRFCVQPPMAEVHVALNARCAGIAEVQVDRACCPSGCKHTDGISKLLDSVWELQMPRGGRG